MNNELGPRIKEDVEFCDVRMDCGLGYEWSGAAWHPSLEILPTSYN